MTLGYIVWWRVKDTMLSPETAERIAEKLGIPAPQRPAPIDVFRKMAGRDHERHDGSIREKVLLHPANSQRTMVVRHIVRHRYVDEVPQSHDRVGEAVFYKPPRDKPSKARMRVSLDEPDDDWLAPFAAQLRADYAAGLDAFDAQGVRRLVRAYLSKVHALYIDGVYHLRNAEDADHLMWLFGQLGGECVCYCIPLEDTEVTRTMLSDALEQAVVDGSKVDLVEAYLPLLGAVPSSLWERLEGAT